MAIFAACLPHFWTNAKTGISSQAKDKLSSKEEELSEEVGAHKTCGTNLEGGHLRQVMIDILVASGSLNLR